MELKANYLIVAGFVATLTVGIFFFVIWLTGGATSVAYTEYRAYFTGSVTGLEVGSIVRYRGMRVGSVTGLNIDPNNSSQIEVAMHIETGTPIKQDTEASVSANLVTGLAVVELSGGLEESPLLKPLPGFPVAIIRSHHSSFENLVQSVSQFLVSTERSLNDRNLEAISNKLDDIRSTTGAMAANDKQIRAAIDDAAATVHGLRDMSVSLDTLITNANTDVGPMVDSVAGQADRANGQIDQVADDLHRMSQSITRVSDELEAAISGDRPEFKDLTNRDLPEASQFILEGRRMIEEVTRVVDKFDAEGGRYLFGSDQQGVPER
ncbi:MAG TPA: MlaD family protein [Alphaproteobacteria bacterium]|nr:MlaD family protein [Alphaproteobacteria bacterium]